MKRREFIWLLGGAALAAPAHVMGQSANRVYRIAALAPFPASVFAPLFDELPQHGFVEGQNLAIDRRGFDGRYEQFPAIALELVKTGPDAIVCAGPLRSVPRKPRQRVFPSSP